MSEVAEECPKLSRKENKRKGEKCTTANGTCFFNGFSQTLYLKN